MNQVIKLISATSQQTSQYFPPSDDLDDYMHQHSIVIIILIIKVIRNLNTSTFTPTPLNKSLSSMTNVTQQYQPNQSRTTFLTGSRDYDYSNSQSNTTTSSDDNLTNQTANSYIHNNSPPLERPTIPPPSRPAPIAPRRNNTGELVLQQSSTNDNATTTNLLSARMPSKYAIAAENEINATDAIYNRNKEFGQDLSKQMQQPITNLNNPNTSSLTMKKPQILSQINKSPLLVNPNRQHHQQTATATATGTTTMNQDTFTQHQTTHHHHLSASDISKPPPMETEI